MPAGEKDADKCIELKPDFAKGYSRKAHVQFFMKEYEKAMETYRKGLTFDPENQELKDGVQRCQRSINKFMMGTASEDEIKERQAKAMSDPEVRSEMLGCCNLKGACAMLDTFHWWFTHMPCETRLRLLCRFKT